MSKGVNKLGNLKGWGVTGLDLSYLRNETDWSLWGGMGVYNSQI